MTVQEVEAWYRRCGTDPEAADVAEHLNLMRRYAACHDRIVELGTYDGTTALAWLMGKPKHLRCVDLVRRPEVDRLEEAAKALGVEFEFTEGNSFVVRQSVCGLLYIDTWHYAEQVLKELEHWQRFVQKTILLHDTESHGDHGMCGGGGMWEGIGTFLKDHPEWRLHWHNERCLGLTCLVRVA